METRRIEETCCFSGHRAAKLPWGYDENDERCLSLKRSLDVVVEQLYADGIRWFICGMALGCDTYFAEAVLRLRIKRPDVKLEAAIPCLDQDGHWSEAQRERYERILDNCDKQTVISHRYTFDCMERRNRYMVEQSRTLVAVFGGGRGGTFNTIRYALKLGREVIELEC